MAATTNGNGRVAYVRPNGENNAVEFWLKKPLSQLEHETSSFFEEHWRIFAVLMRCSVCIPHQSPFAVRPKMRDGTFEDWCAEFHKRVAKSPDAMPLEQAMRLETTDLDDDGSPRPLRNTDFCKVLRWNPKAQHPNVIRALRRLRHVGLVKSGFPFYFDGRPSAIPPREEGVSTDTLQSKLRFTIADLTLDIGVSIDTEICSTDTLQEAVQWAESLRTEWRNDLSRLRETYRTRAREGSTARGILIGKTREIKKTVEVEEDPRPQPFSSVPLPSDTNPETAPEQEARLDDIRQLLRDFSEHYGQPQTPDDVMVGMIDEELRGAALEDLREFLLQKIESNFRFKGWAYLRATIANFFGSVGRERVLTA